MAHQYLNRSFISRSVFTANFGTAADSVVVTMPGAVRVVSATFVNTGSASNAGVVAARARGRSTTTAATQNIGATISGALASNQGATSVATRTVVLDAGDVVEFIATTGLQADKTAELIVEIENLGHSQ